MEYASCTTLLLSRCSKPLKPKEPYQCPSPSRPTTNGATSHAMVDLIFGLNREQGTTLVLVTHDMELAKKCGRVLRLRDGRVVVE